MALEQSTGHLVSLHARDCCYSAQTVLPLARVPDLFRLAAVETVACEFEF